MISWKDLTVQQERYKDFAKEIDHDRLVHLATEGSEHRPIHARAFTWLGVRLSAVGNFLQQRYGPAAGTAVPENILPLGPAAAGTAGTFAIPSEDFVEQDDELAA